jgi:hypothetical protein
MEKEVKIAIFLFIAIIIIVPFYESKRVMIWESQRPRMENEIFRSMIFLYATKCEEIKEKLKIKNFFEKEHYFWLRLKKSPLFFQEKLPEVKEEKKTEEKEKILKEKLKPPYRILIIGDSFIAVYGGVGDPLEKKLISFKDVEVWRLGRVSSGLSRPDYFNWNLTLKELISQHKPNVGIVMIGMNDAQALTDPDGKVVVNYLKFGKEEWIKEYSKRVSDLLEIFEENNVLVFWIGLPIMRDKAYSDKVKILNQIYEEEVKKYENAYFISTWELLTDEKGNYTSYLLDEKGKKNLARASDGIHLTYFGGKIVVEKIIKEMEKTIKFEPKISQ